MLPANRVIINLAPGDLPKQATSFDLPIVLGLLAASGQIATEFLERYAIVGELALDGSTRPVKGALSMAMAMAAKAAGNVRSVILPAANRDEAAVVDGVDVIAVNSLTEAAAFLIVSSPSSRCPAAWRSCSTSSAATKKTSQTCAARRWRSGLLRLPQAAGTICSCCALRRAVQAAC